MKIALVAPLFESVPPQLYGGTERVVSYLAEELVREGHEVTLYASGDSQTSAELVPVVPRALRLDGSQDPTAHHVRMLDLVLRDAPRYDIIHFHIDYLHFPLARALGLTHVTTLHGRLDIPDLAPLYRTYDDLPVVSISNHQRGPLAHANWVGTVYNGLPEQNFRFFPKQGDYLAFLGRTSPEKGIREAIEIALAAGMPLRIAAKVDKVDQDYFDTVIRPYLSHPLIEFIGEIGEREKDEFLGNAAALIFPIQWPEPFGLVMAEAMACGTPVIAYPRGSVPEVIEDGRTGFIVGSEGEAVAAIDRLAEIDRADCRRHFEQRFSARRMAGDYVAVYEQLLAEQQSPRMAV